MSVYSALGLSEIVCGRPRFSIIDIKSWAYNKNALNWFQWEIREVDVRSLVPFWMLVCPASLIILCNAINCIVSQTYVLVSMGGVYQELGG